MPEAAPLWTSAEIAAATGGAPSGGVFAATGVTFDSREVRPGDLFVALVGERDGHDFVPMAFERGAAGVLAEKPVAGPAIVAADTLTALEQLGVAARERAPAKRAAVTGSVGKTSVTQAIAAALHLTGHGHSPVKSFNNHIGVPLTLARMPRDTRRAVFEIGMNHAGEITPLSQMVQPHVAVVTTVGPVHIENFADGEAGVARAKAEIFEGMEPGGAAILNADDTWFDLLKTTAERKGERVLTFGRDPSCDAVVGGVEASEGGSTVVVGVLHGQALRFPIAQSGAHWGHNSLAVLLALGELGVAVETGLEALAGYAPLAGRGAEVTLSLPGGSATLIDESYNANPIAMRAALNTLATRSGRRIAVLTDMLELGPDAERMHAELAGPAVAAGVALVFTAGPAMRTLDHALPAARRGGWAQTATSLAPQVIAALRPGDVVMVKGSNGSKASAVVAALKAAFAGPETHDDRRSGEAG